MRQGRMPILVYLDQNQLLAIGADAVLFDEMMTHIRAGDVVVPCSMLHFLETLKDADPARRAAKVAVLTELAAGTELVDPGAAIEAERQAPEGEGHVDAVRRKLVRRARWAGPLRSLQKLHSLAPSHLAPVVNQILATTASRLSEDRAQAPDLRAAFAAATGERPELVDVNRGRIRFRSVAMRHVLQNVALAKPHRDLTRNDLVDITFLTITVPYFDIVVADSDMHDRVYEARRSAPDLVRARVLRSLRDMPAALQVALANRKPGA